MSATKQAGVDWPSVAKMLGGGAMLGAGAGAAVTFLNHLKELRQNANPPPTDDNTLYLDLPARPQPRRKMASANANTAPTFALSSLAGLVGAGLAYNTVRDVYNRRRKREIEGDLSNEQHVYLGALPGMKQASQYSLPTKVVGTGYLGFLLTALGSAVVANKMLQKRFPPIQPATAGQPKRIVIRSVDPKTHQPVSEMGSSDVSPDAMEGVVRTQMADTKMASHNDVVNVVCAVAAGRADEITSIAKEAGIDGMLDAVKGASQVDTDPVNRNLAITWICNDPFMREALAPTIASEFFKSASWTFDLLPRLHTLGLDEDHLVGLVEASTQAVRANTLSPVLDKCASVKSAEEGISPLKTLFFAGALKSIMDDGITEHDDSVHGQSTNVMKSEDSPQGDRIGRPRQGVDLEVDDTAASQWAKKNLPTIDKTLARNT